MKKTRNECGKKTKIGGSLFIHGDAVEKLETLAPRKFQLILSSPPYNIGKSYERNRRLTLDEYIEWQTDVIRNLVKYSSDDGSICWQVGNYVRDGEVVPLDLVFYNIFKELGFKLRNRIIWRFNFGLNALRRFSGRYETVLWFTKTDTYKFNLDPVRIPQLYPGKRHPRGKIGKAGQPSGNPLGKNPSDYWEFSAESELLLNPIWEIPNVKSRHPEKTLHPCQFPIELAERFVLALTEKGDYVLDPFVGTGASVLAAAKHGRLGIGIDRERTFLEIAEERLTLLQEHRLPMRPIGMPVRRPKPAERVARVPDEWKRRQELAGT